MRHPFDGYPRPEIHFDEHATDLDAWRADQSALRRSEFEQHARIDKALTFGNTNACSVDPGQRKTVGHLDHGIEQIEVSPRGVPLDPRLHAVYREVERAVQSNALSSSLSDADSIDRDLHALDRIAAVFTRKAEATNLEAILLGLNEIRAILRETGRQV